MARIVAVVNQKGGVGKTTTSVNLASAFASIGQKTLFIDMDRSGNGTRLFGQKRVDTEKGDPHSECIADVIRKRGTADSLISKTDFGVDIIRSSKKLDTLNSFFDEPKNSTRRFFFFQQFLDTKVVHSYDVVVVDTKPEKNDLISAILTACNYYIIPLFADAFSSDGLEEQVEICENIRMDLNSSMRFLGAVITNYKKDDPNHIAFQKAIREIGKEAKFKVMKTVIPNSRSVGTAARKKVPLSTIAKHLPAWTAYSALAGEILPNIEGKGRGRKPQPIKGEHFSRLNAFNKSEPLEMSLEF